MVVPSRARPVGRTLGVPTSTNFAHIKVALAVWVDPGDALGVPPTQPGGLRFLWRVDHMGFQGAEQLFIVAFFDNLAAASVATRAAIQGDVTASDLLEVGLLTLDARGRIVVSATREGEPQRDEGLQAAVGMLARAAASQEHVATDPTDLAPLDLTTEDVTRIVAELEAGQGAVAVIGDRSTGRSLVLRLTGLGGRVEVHGFANCPNGDA